MIRTSLGTSRLGVIAFASFFAMAVPGVVTASSAPQARVSADALLGTINVPLDETSAFSPTLAAGTTYRLVATGTVTETEPITPLSVTSDALTVVNAALGSHLIVRYEGDPGQPSFDSLNPATNQTYNTTHRYEETFTAARAGRIEAFLKPMFQVSSFSGGLKLELYGPAPGTAPGPGRPPGGPAGPPALLAAPAAWGKTIPTTALGAGDRAIVPSPPIGANQKQANVTVSGDPTGKTDVVFATQRRKAVVECITHALEATILAEIQDQAEWEEDRWDPEEVPDYPGFGKRRARVFIENLFGCLELLEKGDAISQRVGSASGVDVTTRSSCKARSLPVHVRVNRAAKKLRWRVRRPSRKSPTRFLRTSCRRAKNGTVTLRVRTRSRRVKLRKLVGPRLFVGIQRSATATGSANVGATFKR